MIGGLVAMTLDRSILRQLGTGRRTVVVTGTNGKSTTTALTAHLLASAGFDAHDAWRNLTATILPTGTRSAR